MNRQDMSSEILAMAAIETALKGLDEEARIRVLKWAAQRYKATVGPMNPDGPAGESSDRDNAGEETEEFETFAELYARAAPATDADRVLLSAYWLQEVEGQKDLDSRSINNQLRDLGHAVGHMPSAFEGLLGRKPQPVVQTRKTGKSKQATKRYKVTHAGKNVVQSMVHAGAGA